LKAVEIVCLSKRSEKGSKFRHAMTKGSGFCHSPVLGLLLFRFFVSVGSCYLTFAGIVKKRFGIADYMCVVFFVAYFLVPVFARLHDGAEQWLYDETR
jgi:hypothetical protein